MLFVIEHIELGVKNLLSIGVSILTKTIDILAINRQMMNKQLTDHYKGECDEDCIYCEQEEMEVK